MPATLSPFKQAAVAAVADALGLPAELFVATTPPDAALGDLAIGCFPAAKAKKGAPPTFAAQVAAAFRPTELLTAARATGPYVNFTIDRGALYRQLLAGAANDTLIPQSAGAGKTVCVDFSSPNIAKQLGYHHIRSTVIGHALVGIHRALGFRVVGINHLGDWGTTFGMIIAAIHEWGPPEPFDIAGINAIYVRFRAKIKEEPSWEQKGRDWFKKLESGDADARALWERIRAVSWAEFNQIYDLLGIVFEEVRGEAAYESAMQGVIDMLAEKQLTSISEEALVVDLTAEGIEVPLLLRKNDGATLYATRDLAAAIYRWETYHFDRSLYVVDKGQALHFKQLFTTLGKAGFAWAPRCQHVPFGLVRIGGKKAGNRSGNVVLLKEVLAEAQEGISAFLAEKNAELPVDKRDQIARQVGLGAIVFANLFTQREKDVDFDLEQITSFDGDSAPYIQYSHARASSVLRKAPAELASGLDSADVSKLTLPEEWALARLCAELPDVLLRSAEGLEPHHVTRHLLDVSSAYSRWFALGNQDPLLKTLTADAEVSKARLALTRATRVTLELGLKVLGIAAPDEM